MVQAGWGGNGWASPWLGSDNKDDYFMGCGVIDFAGSGVVHMTGGVAALVGATLLGPRKSFVDGVSNVPTYGAVFQTLGTLILWFGWYGFNGGSTLYIVGYGQVAAKVMVCTTISAASGALGTLALGSALDSMVIGTPVIKLTYVNNGVLAGLVGITASCSVVEPYGAMIIGLGAAFVYIYSSKLLKKLGIDDVVDAIPVHGFCGCYGVIMAGLFATKENYAAAYGIYDGAVDECAGAFYGGSGAQLGANIVFVLFVLCWTGSCSLVVFGGLKITGLLRVSAEVEEEGMDSSEHGIAMEKKSVVEVPASGEAPASDKSGGAPSNNAVDEAFDGSKSGARPKKAKPAKRTPSTENI